MTGSEESAPPQRLAAFARALLAHTEGPLRALADLLREHPGAVELLTEALLAVPPEAAPPPTSPATPESDAPQIGAYRLVRQIGRGGQAAVHEAIDVRLGRRVALKVLHADTFDSTHAIERFRAEAMTTSRLDHPGICPVHEIGEQDGNLFLAMRLVEGTTLAEWIRRAKGSTPWRPPPAINDPPGSHDSEPRSIRPWSATLRLFESVTAALQVAHDAGIAHRDIKPANIMVQADGTGVVLDFGLAADRERTSTLTRTGDVFGTPAYMAPEQCRGERTDQRVDVFALGATLFEALTGKRAFDGPTPEAILRQILSGRVPDPRQVNRQIPRELAIVIGKALEPDPARRYARIAELGDDLARIRTARPILAVPPGTWLRARRWVQRSPWRATAIALLAVGLPIGAWSWRSATAARSESVLIAGTATLRDLRDQVAGLHPIASHRAAAEAWLERADRLVQERPAVLQALAELRTADDATSTRLPAPPDIAAELRRLDDIDAGLRAGFGHPETLAWIASGADRRRQRRDDLRELVDQRRHWTFADVDRQRRHDSLAKLAADLEQFAGPAGELTQVSRELAASTATPVSWDEATRSIRMLPAYRELELRPQTGLQPLGVDPITGLWRFAHLRSGPPPTVHPDGSLGFANDTGIVLILIPGGRTVVGTQKTDAGAARYFPGQRDLERYLVHIDLAPYFIAMHETTQAQWLAMAGRNPSFWPARADGQPDRRGVTPRNPVEWVAWAQCDEVLRRCGLALPTEAQWEHAARAAPYGAERPPDPTALRLAENWYDQTAVTAKVSSTITTPLAGSDGFPVHAPVGSFAANAFGLFDVMGNVQEWCADAENYPDAHVMRPADGLWVGNDSLVHGIRGGHFLADLTWDVFASRTQALTLDKHIGVRAARAVE